MSLLDSPRVTEVRIANCFSVKGRQYDDAYSRVVCEHCSSCVGTVHLWHHEIDYRYVGLKLSRAAYRRFPRGG